MPIKSLALGSVHDYQKIQLLGFDVQPQFGLWFRTHKWNWESSSQNQVLIK